MTRPRAAIVIATAIASIGIGAIPAQAAKERTCFYYSNSGLGLWATQNVRCSTARRVYRAATQRCGGRCAAVYRIDGYRCTLSFDGGGNGICTAWHGRRIRFSVP